jgi:hypothetical protein
MTFSPTVAFSGLGTGPGVDLIADGAWRQHGLSAMRAFDRGLRTKRLSAIGATQFHLEDSEREILGCGVLVKT